MTVDEMRIAIAEARGWIWYRLPGKNVRVYRALFHPTIHEYEGQAPEWMVRADGTEQACNMGYMEREGRVPKLDQNAIAEAVDEIALLYGGDFCMRLREIVVRDSKDNPVHAIDTGIVHDVYFYNATARDRKSGG